MKPQTFNFMRANVLASRPKNRFQTCPTSWLNPHALHRIATPSQWVAFRVILSTPFFLIWNHPSTYVQTISNGQTLRGTDWPVIKKKHTDPGAEGDAMMVSRSRDDACTLYHSAAAIASSLFLGTFAGPLKTEDAFRFRDRKQGCKVSAPNSKSFGRLPGSLTVSVLPDNGKHHAI